MSDELKLEELGPGDLPAVDFGHEGDEKAASDERVPFTGIWLEADAAVLWQRVGARRGGPSDATVDVLARQLERQVEDMSWHRIDAGGSVTDIADAILSLCRLHEPN